MRLSLPGNGATSPHCIPTERKRHRQNERIHNHYNASSRECSTTSSGRDYWLREVPGRSRYATRCNAYLLCQDNSLSSTAPRHMPNSIPDGCFCGWNRKSISDAAVAVWQKKESLSVPHHIRKNVPTS